MNMQELDGLAADVDALFGISGLKEDLMDVALLGASAGVAVIGWEVLYAKVGMLNSLHPAAKAGLAVGTGIAGGIALGRFVHKAVGAGVAAGLIGWGIAKGVQFGAAKAGVNLAQVSDRDLLLGLGNSMNTVDNDIEVRDYLPMPGQTRGLDGNSQAHDYESMPGQVAGLGQAGGGGNVSANDMAPMPGVHGRQGFLAAIVA